MIVELSPSVEVPKDDTSGLPLSSSNDNVTDARLVPVLHCFSLVKSTVIGGELSGDISHRNMCLLVILVLEWHSKNEIHCINIILLETNLHHKFS